MATGPGTASPSWRCAAPLAGVVTMLVALVACSNVLPSPEPSASHRATDGGGGSSHSSDPTATSTSPSPAPPTWQLREVALPMELAGHSVLGVSPDGETILVGDASAFSSVHLVTPTEVVELVVPGHTAGTPVVAQLSPDARFVVLMERGRLWRFNIAAHTYDVLPNAPGTEGAIGWALSDSGRLLVLTGRVASVEFGGATDTALWTLDLSELRYERLGTRTDGIAVYPLTGGAALLSDESVSHDNSGWVVHGMRPDGSDEVLYDIGRQFGVVAAFALSPDGTALAVTLADNGTWILEASAEEAIEVSAGRVIDFSPDGAMLRMALPDGWVKALDREGTVIATVSGPTTGWVAAQ